MKERLSQNMPGASFEKEPFTIPHLDDILLDRKMAEARMTKGNIESTEIDAASFKDLNGEQREFVESNLEVLSYLNGHKGADLRRIVHTGSTPEAVHLRGLLDWSRNFAQGQSADISTIAEALPLSLRNLSETSVYERIAFLEKHPETDRENIASAMQSKMAEALGVTSDKWNDVIAPLFDNPYLAKGVIEQVGSLPEDIFTKKKFKSVDARQIVELTEVLRKMEGSELGHEALHERAHLINHFFISRRAETLRVKDRANIEIDSNGMLIKLAGFYSHLPFGLVEEATVRELVNGNWINENEANEILVQKAKSNNQPSLVIENVEKLDKEFSDKTGVMRESFFTYLREGSMQEMATKVINGELIIPDSWIELADNREESALLLKFAEELIRSISGFVHTYESEGLKGYGAQHAVHEGYAVQSQILNSPNYYNIAKIVQHVIGLELTSSPDEEFATFRGQFKKSKEGVQHSFIGSVHEGKMARVLINEKKHIPPQLRPSLEQLPAYDAESYSQLEAALQTFNSFSTSLDRISMYSKTGALLGGEDAISAREDCLDAIENGLHFLLNNVSARYAEASSQYESLKSSDPLDVSLLTSLIKTMGEAKSVYSEFLYRNIADAKVFESRFSPEVVASKVEFGKSFIDGATEKGIGNLDSDISNQQFTIRAVSVNYTLENPSETIPFHIEESCLDALRIDRNRPLINIIGGCKHLDSEENPLEVFSEAVVNVAHKYKANVAVPGTQSGIGTVFGKENIEYSAHFDHLPVAEKAHFFSINPGGSVYFPGNAFVNQESGSVYPTTSVDTLVTPVPAEWNKKGLDKYTSKYSTHIAYMESLYHRMTIGQEQVVVVGNGGLYSVMEVVESLKGDIRLLLVNNTGRFAEAASVLAPHAAGIVASENPHAEIMQILNGGMEPKSLAEFYAKDFGAQEIPENDDFVVYRDYFMRFLRLVKDRSDRVFDTDLDSLETVLEGMLETKK